MDTKNSKAVDYIKKYILELVAPTQLAEWDEGFVYYFQLPKHNITIQLMLPQVSDLQQLIESDQTSSDKFRASWNSIRFHILVVLGKNGLILDVLVSRMLLEDQREWLHSFKTNLKKDTWLYECFKNGLGVLADFLDKIISDVNISSASDFAEEYNYISGLLSFYEKNRHFSDEASEKSLGYFKAAALVEIIMKEAEEKTCTIPRVKKKINEDIYKIVEALQESPFPQIQMPALIYDYAHNAGNIPIKLDNGKPIVFISYASEEFELAEFVRDVLLRLTDGRMVPFVAKRDIPSGSNPLKVMLDDHLKFAKAIIPICSERSKGSSWVWWESSAVWAKGNKVHPVFTNILANGFGSPLTLVCQGKEFFIEQDFLDTMKMVCLDSNITLETMAFNDNEAKEFLRLKEKYSKPDVKVDLKTLQLMRNFLSILNGELKEIFQALFVGANQYLYADPQWVLLNYKDFNTTNKNTLWSDLIRLDIFHENSEIFNRINAIYFKLEDLNVKIRVLKPERHNLNAGSIDIHNYRDVMSEIKSLYVSPKGDTSSYEETTIGEFFAKTLKNLP